MKSMYIISKYFADIARIAYSHMFDAKIHMITTVGTRSSDMGQRHLNYIFFKYVKLTCEKRMFTWFEI